MKSNVNPQRLSEIFRKLVTIDSISRKENRIAQEIIQLTESMVSKFYIDNAGESVGGDTGNLILKIKGNRPVAPIMINAHMDTVEPGTGIAPCFKDGVFTSDGSTILGADDKSAIAIIIEALNVISDQNLPHGPIDIVFTICEEIGLLGAKYLDWRLIDARFGFALDTSDIKSIITRAPAANRFEIIVHGKDAHAGADPENGINAILLASKAIAELNLGRIDDETTCNIGVIEAPGATNIVPNKVLVKGEARSHDEAKLERVTNQIVSSFENVVAEYRHRHSQNDLPRIDLEIENEFPRTHIPEDHQVVALAKKAATNLGRTLISKRTGGGSDANIFFNKGIVTGVIGTGMKDMHTVRESISLDDMAKTVSLLLEIINIHSTGF